MIHEVHEEDHKEEDKALNRITWFMAKRKSAMAVARTSGATTSTITVKRIANLRKISIEQRVEAHHWFKLSVHQEDVRCSSISNFLC